MNNKISSLLNAGMYIEILTFSFTNLSLFILKQMQQELKRVRELALEHGKKDSSTNQKSRLERINSFKSIVGIT